MKKRFLWVIRYAVSATGYDPLTAPLSVLSRNEKGAGNSHSSYRIARSGYRIFILLYALYASPFTLYAANSLASGTSVSSVEEGKALFESGRYQDAISKFIMVLRSDPQNPEARQYLRQSVDQLRQNPTASARRGLDGAPAPTAQKEMRAMLQKRAALTLDLMAIPGVQVNTQNAVTQVIIETGQFFGDNNGGLKEEGVPILDRVSAWLKTFGQQPIIIHCYPEETQDVTSTGALFLRRYSELYNFFIEERKLSPQRLISADLLAEDAAAGRAAKESNADTKPRIVIETLGSQSSFMEGAMPSLSPRTAIARWLEFAVISQRDTFNPDEGEWATLDIAALSRTGLRSWNFKIVPEDAPANAAGVFELSGTGNVLKRLNWDGRNPKTGSFVREGAYIARITATDSDGSIKTEQVLFRIEHTVATETLTNVEKPATVVKKAKKTKKKKKKAAPMAVTTPATEVPTPAAPEATAETPSASASAATPAEPAEDSSHAIWKQIIQFETGGADLAPSVVPSLERIGKTLEVYPLQKVRIVGFGSTKEDGALLLAKKRAQAVRRALLDQYHVDGKRVLMGGAKVNDGDGMSKVELSITN